jgi:hypothetical protein
MVETVFAILWTDFLALGVIDPNVEPAVVLREFSSAFLALPPVIDIILLADLIRKNSDGTRSIPP